MHVVRSLGGRLRSRLHHVQVVGVSPLCSVSEVIGGVEGFQSSRSTVVPYPHSYPTSHTLQKFRDQAQWLEDGARQTDIKVRIAGRVTSIRKASSKLAFVDIVDGNGVTVQVLAARDHYTRVTDTHPTSEEAFSGILGCLSRGDIIGVAGFPGKSNKGEISVIPHSIEVLAPCLRNIPLKLEDKETRQRLRYLDLLVNPERKDVFRARSKVIRALRKFFDDREFLEVETPILYPSAGGATARPFTTRARAFNAEMQLRVAPELFLKQLVVGGLERVYELGKVFRNEGITPNHNPEFSTLEYYEAYADLEDLITTTETLLRDVAVAVNGTSDVPLVGAHCGEVVDLSKPFARIDVAQGLEDATGMSLPDLGAEDAHVIDELEKMCLSVGAEVPRVRTVGQLFDALIAHCLEPQCVHPTFLTGHPEALSPLAKPDVERPGYTHRFELFVGTRELCNAYIELNNPVVQRDAFAMQQKDIDRGDEEAMAMDEAYCTALEYGLPPTGGWGMGIDRLVMFLTQKEHIREVLLFPVIKPRTCGFQPCEE